MRIGIKANTRLSAGLFAFVEGFAEGVCSNREVERLNVFAGPRGRLLVGWGEEGLSEFSDCSAEIRLCPGAFRGRLALSVYDRVFFPRRVSSADIDALLCPGNVAVRVPGAKTIYWPQTVLPLARKNGELGRLQEERSGRTGVFERLLLARIASSCRQADGIIFSSNYARRLYEKVIGIDSKTAVVYPPGKRLHRAASRWKGEQEDCFLFVSTLSTYKMVSELVQGFAEFLDSQSPRAFRLLIVGRAADRGYGEKVDSLIADLGLHGSVRRLGFVADDELSDLYRRCKYFVFPSACENAGSFALLDALAYGKVVLCSSLSSMKEICGSAALYFDPRDPMDIAACLRGAVERPEIASAMSEKAFERSSELGGWQRVVDETVAFIQKVAADA